MLNVIATGKQYPQSLTVETNAFKGINGARVQTARSVAIGLSDVTQSINGVIKGTTTRANFDLGPKLQLLTLGVSAPVEAEITHLDGTVTKLKVNKVLTLDDETAQQLVLKFTPQGEVTECQFWINWATQNI